MNAYVKTWNAFSLAVSVRGSTQRQWRSVAEGGIFNRLRPCGGVLCDSQRGGGERGVGALELAVERDAALIPVVRQQRRQVQHLL